MYRVGNWIQIYTIDNYLYAKTSQDFDVNGDMLYYPWQGHDLTGQWFKDFPHDINDVNWQGDLFFESDGLIVLHLQYGYSYINQEVFSYPIHVIPMDAFPVFPALPSRYINNGH